ncbi:hypothetical protein ACMU_17970 [Actibacterium mucosum KCTC 23349]|uniref:Acyltransferase 3 domain-containing protein n=1 Tax=Actibacterium mucosum KCTC 23349 TaxID=1454373 RepID=A0A037ZG46_9RHOB|nr:acyltransferase [Actibacterium mucosum]KAJ54593.1 hypothetical protein ACMU_17970 [Actibacterium mucosum KCTC 23349]
MNPNLNAFRGISILIVALYHYTSRLPPDAFLPNGQELGHFFRFGWIGVYVFFAISGYCILGSYLRSADSWEFFAKRVARIYPLFVVSSTVVFLYITLFHVPSFSRDGWSFNAQDVSVQDYVFTTFFLANDLGFTWVDGAYWTLLVEVKFYFIIALVFGLIARHALHISEYIFGFALPLAWVFSIYADIGPAEKILRNIFLAPYFPFFVIGMRAAVDEKLSWRLGVHLAVSAVVMYHISAGKSSFYEETWVTMIAYATLIGLLVVAFFKPTVNMFPKAVQPLAKLLGWIGVYSYAWYLVHQKIGLSVVAMSAPVVGGFVAVLLAILFTIALAYLLSWLVENRYRKHVQQIVLKVFGAVRPQPANKA